MLPLVSACAVPIGPIIQKALAVPPPPKIGTCHNLDYIDITSKAVYFDSKPPVDCTEPHTSVTYKTGDLPMTLSMKSFEVRNAGADAAIDFAERACKKAVTKATGLTQGQIEASWLTHTPFLPTLAEVQDGANWFRCDLAAIFDETALQLPPTSQIPLFKDGVLPDSLALCATQRGALVLCTQRHAYLYNNAFEMPGGYYPTPRQFRREAAKHRHCEGDTLNWPPKSAWRDGDHWVWCGFKARSTTS